MTPTLNEVLGPLLGFLFTTATLVFIAVFAKKTRRPQLEAATSAEPQPVETEPGPSGASQGQG